MASDASDLETLDKVRLVLDYAPAEAVDGFAEDDEERELLASLDRRIDRDVEVTRVREATVVVERPQVVEVLGVTCPDCRTAFEVEADGPLPRSHACPNCAAEGVLEPHGEAATFAVPTPEPEDAEEEPDETEAVEETTEDPASATHEPAEAFAVPDHDAERLAFLQPLEGIAATATAMEPAVDPVDALTPDEEPEEGSAVVEPAGADDEPEDDEEFTFTPPTAQDDDETTDAVQDLLDEDLDLGDEEDEAEEEDRGEAFDEVDWPEEEETEDDAFDVVGPAGEGGEDEEDWPESEPVDDDVDEPDWPELEEEDEAAEEPDEGDWPELEDEAEDEAQEDVDEAADDPAGSEAETADPEGDEVPSEWAGRDLEDEPEVPADDEPAAGARGGLPLDQVPGIESFYIDQLAECGYETTADMVADEAYRISEDTGIATALVEKWRAASQLVQERDVGAGYAAVLAEGDVTGPGDLDGRDPEDLADDVNGRIADSDVDLDPVTGDDVAAWT